MSENVTHSTEEFSEIAHHEVAFEDSFIVDALRICKEYNDLLATTDDVTEQECVQILTELGIAWGNIVNEEVVYTGKASITTPKGENREAFLYGASVISQGFVLVREIEDTDLLGQGPYRVMHKFAVPVEYFYDALEQLEIGAESTHAFVTVDIQNGHIETKGASPEHAREWLSYACPQLIEDIDAVILNIEKEDEDALIALKQFRINRYPEVQDDFTRKCLVIYINSIIELDRNIPYMLGLKGFGRVESGDDTSAYLNFDTSVLAYVSTIDIMPAFTFNKNYPKYDIRLRLVLVNEDRNGAMQPVSIPLTTAKVIVSLRNELYGTR